VPPHSGDELTSAELEVIKYYIELALALPGGREQLDALFRRKGLQLTERKNPEGVDTRPSTG
jgi:hypothetical protein